MLNESLVKGHTKKFIKTESWKEYVENAKKIPFVRVNNRPNQYFNIEGRPVALSFMISSDFKHVDVSEYLPTRKIFRQVAYYPLDELKPKKRKVSKETPKKGEKVETKKKTAKTSKVKEDKKVSKKKATTKKKTK